MSTSDIMLTNDWWNRLRYLSADVKLRLASMLTASVADDYEKTVGSEKSKTDSLLEAIAGKWEDTRSADEMVNDIYSSRRHAKASDYINPFEA